MKTQALAAIVSLLILTGCTQGSELVGKWKSSTGETMEFLKAGTVTIELGPPEFGVMRFMDAVSGDYEVIDSSHIRFELGGPFGKVPSVAEYTISGSTLTVKFPGEETKSYQRQ